MDLYSTLMNKIMKSLYIRQFINFSLLCIMYICAWHAANLYDNYIYSSNLCYMSICIICILNLVTQLSYLIICTDDQIIRDKY